jgi:DNA polymerase III alpha subunit
VEDVLWNEDGTWKHSKFNKRALESLIKIGAFGSLDCVGAGKLFNSYHVMHEVIIENADLIKKSLKKEPGLGRKNFYELTRKFNEEMSEWSSQEMAQNKIEVFGALDASTLIDPAVFKLFEKNNVRSIDAHDGQGIYWFCIQKSYPKMTKAKRPYLLVEAVGTSGKPIKVHVWSWDSVPIPDYAVCYAEVSRNDFGFSTSLRKLKIL